MILHPSNPLRHELEGTITLQQQLSTEPKALFLPTRQGLVYGSQVGPEHCAFSRWDLQHNCALVGRTYCTQVLCTLWSDSPQSQKELEHSDAREL